MTQYGYAFDHSFDPSKTSVYELFVNIYSNPKLTKTKDDDKNSIYMGKTSCMLINECRYLIATVPNDGNNIGTTIELSKLYWTNFQTRTLKGKFTCNTCSSANTLSKSPLLKLVERTPQYTQYVNNELQIKVSLLHTKTNNLYEYPNNGDLISALELYNTIITF
jgi:hypothetical protein